MNFLDPYELRARYAPAVIVASPIIITLFALLPLVQETSNLLVQFGGSALVFVFFAYLFSFVVRACGRRIENNLWEGWGGPPSTRFLRWSDSMFGENLKQQVHDIVERKCGIKLLSKDEEVSDGKAADKCIAEAFAQVKAIVRRNDPTGVCLIHNAEYGFLRNLLGSWGIWFVLAVIGAGVCGALWFVYRNDTLLVGGVLNALLAVSAVILRLTFLPKSTKTAADRYAESSWTMFLAAIDAKEKP